MALPDFAYIATILGGVGGIGTWLGYSLKDVVAYWKQRKAKPVVNPGKDKGRGKHKPRNRDKNNLPQIKSFPAPIPFPNRLILRYTEAFIHMFALLGLYAFMLMTYFIGINTKQYWFDGTKVYMSPLPSAILNSFLFAVFGTSILIRLLRMVHLIDPTEPKKEVPFNAYLVLAIFFFIICFIAFIAGSYFNTGMVIHP